MNIRPYQTGQSYYSSEQNRANDMRRDNDTVKVPKITLYDVDYAIFYHLSENVKPQITENGQTRVQVPVMFAAGEKWGQIRQYGFLRDNDRKIMAPLMTLRRLDVASDDRISLPATQLGRYNFQTTYRIIPFRNTSMQYDKIAGQYLTKENYEYYMLDFPDYVRVNYELLIWTDLQEQMNNLVQTLLPMSNHLWGDYYSFRTQITSCTHDNINAPGENRIIKTTMNLQVDAYLRNEFEYQNSKIQKAYSVKRVRFMEETDDEILFNSPNDIDIPSNDNPADNIDTRELKRKIRF